MPLDRLIRLFSSLKLTVVCLALATILVFVGTLAQVTLGLYEVQARYFQSFFVYWNLPGTGIRIPVFPGGYLIGGVLLVNLAVAYTVRLGFRRVHTGLLLVHAGLVLLLLGQLWTDLSQRESVMQLAEGQTKSYSESQRLTELAVIAPAESGQEQVVAVPQSRLRPGTELQHPLLPFTVKVQQFWLNSAPLRGQTNITPLATRGIGQREQFVERPPVTTTDTRNVPAALIEIVGAEGSLGTWLVSDWLLEPQPVEYQGKTYSVALRLARYYKPFSITLLEARHDKYMGTEIPRNFSSRVRVQHAVTGEDREVLIYMNNPLRYGGFTFYQYQMAADEVARQRQQRATSTLQVVQNPGWLVPYIACILVGLGLTLQFGTHLLAFARRRIRGTRHPAPEETIPAPAPRRSASPVLTATTTNLSRP